MQKSKILIIFDSIQILEYCSGCQLLVLALLYIVQKYYFSETEDNRFLATYFAKMIQWFLQDLK